MTDEQARLPLNEEPYKEERNRSRTRDLPTSQDSLVPLSDILKSLDKARRAISSAVKGKQISLNEALSVHNKAIAALQALTLEGALRNLEQERDRLLQNRDDVLTRRRKT